MKTLLKVLGTVLLALVLLVGGVYGWASFKTRSLLARHIAVHTVDFPIPFPLTPEEVAQIQDGDAASAADAEASGGTDLEQIALERAIARGKHLVESRYGCNECHGKDFGGGTMVDVAPIGHLFGPNITLGAGSRTLAYKAADWDHMVRHGIKPDGTPGAMPSEDFQRMSDQELSDIVSYIRSQPPVDAEIARPVLGPIGKLLMATGKLPLAADVIDHTRPHPATPPAAEPTVAFGEHIAGVCKGCHRDDLTGGPVPGGDPSWPPAANLTPHADGLAGWSFDQFVSTFVHGRKPDGTELREPMSTMVLYAQQMTDVEVQALWAYLQSVPAKPSADK